MATQPKWERELRALFDKHGLIVVNCELVSGSKLKVMLRAPNNATRTFFFSASADIRARKNDDSILKRFAQSNPAPVPTAVGAAMAAAGVDHVVTAPAPAPLVRTVQRGSVTSADIPRIEVHTSSGHETRFEIRSEGVMLPALRHDLCATECDGAKHDGQKPCSLKCEIVRLTPTKPNETMTATTTSTPKNGNQIARLSRPEFHKLCKWVAANVTDGQQGYMADLCRQAAKALGLEVVSESTMREALELEEITLAAPPKKTTDKDRVRVIARHLKHLYEKLGEEVPEDIMDIVRGRSPQEAA